MGVGASPDREGALKLCWLKVIWGVSSRGGPSPVEARMEDLALHFLIERIGGKARDGQRAGALAFWLRLGLRTPAPLIALGLASAHPVALGVQMADAAGSCTDPA